MNDKSMRDGRREVIKGLTQSIEGEAAASTAGTGSFSATVAMDLLSRGARRIEISSRDEAEQYDMRHRFADERFRHFSSTHKAVHPGGDQCHRRQVERFAVLASQAWIPLHRPCTDDTGSEPLYTSSWTDDLFDPDPPDTIAEVVYPCQ